MAKAPDEAMEAVKDARRLLQKALEDQAHDHYHARKDHEQAEKELRQRQSVLRYHQQEGAKLQERRKKLDEWLQANGADEWLKNFYQSLN